MFKNLKLFLNFIKIYLQNYNNTGINIAMQEICKQNLEKILEINIISKLILPVYNTYARNVWFKVFLFRN